MFGVTMRRIFKTAGKLHMLKDSDGQLVKDWEHSVIVDAKYELKPSPHQPLVVDIYGCNLSGLGQCVEKLVLDNGVILTGCTLGGSMKFNTGELRKMRMKDVEESKIELYPNKTVPSAKVELDAAVFGVVSSDPLRKRSCTKGVARPGYPFSYSKTFPDLHKGTWAQALRLQYHGTEITFVATSNYWKGFVDETTLQHDSIVGVRPQDGGDMGRADLNKITFLLAQFIGWINHCVSPVFHVKGYRKGKLVYCEYDLYPHPTVHRERFSWLPWHGVEVGDGRVPVQDLFDGFVKAWEKNEQEMGTLHIALQMLRSREKGSPLDKPSIVYLRDTFTACAILEGMLTGKSGKSGRASQISRCLKVVGVENKLPSLDKKEFDHVLQTHPKLWWNDNKKKVMEDEKGTLSYPLANMTNWMLHIDDPDSARRLLTLPIAVQTYLLEVSMRLADLMMLKEVGYGGAYFNRLTGKTEIVPWSK